MECQRLYSKKNKKYIIDLSSAECAQRVIKVNLNRSFACKSTYTFYFIFICIYIVNCCRIN